MRFLLHPAFSLTATIYLFTHIFLVLFLFLWGNYGEVLFNSGNYILESFAGIIALFYPIIVITYIAFIYAYIGAFAVTTILAILFRKTIGELSNYQKITRSMGTLCAILMIVAWLKYMIITDFLFPIELFYHLQNALSPIIK